MIWIPKSAIFFSRFEKFSEKIADIDKHNEEFEKGNAHYNRDVNQFADMVIVIK